MQFEQTADNNKVIITLRGDYILHSSTPSPAQFVADLQKENITNVTFNSKELGAWDSSLVVFLFYLVKLGRATDINIDLKTLPKNLERLINLALKVDRKPESKRASKLPFLESLGEHTLIILDASSKSLQFIKDIFKSFVRFCKSKAIMRKVDFLFALEDCTYKAVGIVSLVSFMVGLILAFVGAIQLKAFGAQIYVASLVAIGMIRIMGAIMMGIIMAGRTGASYAATIGTMQVNEEIDALKTMGIPTSDFLVIPRITSLIIAMPFLTVLADIMGILGGAAVGITILGISPQEYWQYTYDALAFNDFFVGLFYSIVYGFIIAACGCYYGINCGRDADSVGIATTKAVVSAIVWMIVATGILTVIFEVLGI